MDTAKKTGLVLGSGGAKGLAHIGVIQALRKAGMRIDVVCGASIGALIGALYAAGVDFGQLRKLVEDMNWMKLASIFSPKLSTKGIVDGRRVESFLKNLMGDLQFSDLRIPFAAIASDIYTGEMVVFTEGSVVEAVRASISVPGIFVPYAYGGSFLVDGGLVNPVPIDIARSLGSEYIVCVPVCTDVKKRMTKRRGKHTASAASHETSIVRIKDFSRVLKQLLNREQDASPVPENGIKAPNMIEVLMNTVYIMESQLTGRILGADPPDMIIRPEVDAIMASDFARGKTLIRLGEEAAERALAVLSR